MYVLTREANHVDHFCAKEGEYGTMSYETLIGLLGPGHEKFTKKDLANFDTSVGAGDPASPEDGANQPAPAAPERPAVNPTLPVVAPQAAADPTVEPATASPDDVVRRPSEQFTPAAYQAMEQAAAIGAGRGKPPAGSARHTTKMPIDPNSSSYIAATRLTAEGFHVARLKGTVPKAKLSPEPDHKYESLREFGPVHQG